MIINLLKTFSNAILLLSFFVYSGLGLTALIIPYLIYCAYKYYTEDTKLFYQETKINQQIVENSKLINKKFKPHFFLSDHILQLIFQKCIQVKSPNLNFTLQKVNDTGAILEWIDIKSKEISEENLNSRERILFILPGLTGGKHDSYICNFSYEGLKNNYIVVIYQNRLLTNEFFYPIDNDEKKFDFFEDLDHALDLVQKKHPGKKIYAVGFSYGANKLVKYLGTKNLKTKRIHCGVSLANPFDMLVCLRTLSGLMDNLLLSFLKNVVNRNFEKYAHLNDHFEFDVDKTLKSKTVKEFDENSIRRFLGYETVDDYYRGISCAQDIRKVEVPLLCVNALDDSISNPKCIPFDEVKLNENLIFMVTRSGSHLGWISNQSFFKLKQWIHQPILDFFNSIE